ncbi:MAG: ATP-binding cassette domain-containing protein, partial [Planctomycetota bacterium]
MGGLPRVAARRAPVSSASTRPDPAFVVRLEGVTLWRSDLHRPWGSPPLEDDRALLERVSLSLAPGTVAVLLGPSGSGKSSLLRLCNRLERPRAGAIELLGRGLDDWPIAALRRTATLVGPSAALFGGSVREELERPLRWAGRAPEP